MSSLLDRDTPPLGRSDAAFRLLVENVRDYAIFMLDPQGRVASWNAGAERIKGYRSDEILGEHFSRFYTPADAAAGRWQRELDAAMRDGRVEDIGWRVRKDGSRFWASVVITAIYDEHRRHVGFAKVTRDLTESAYRAFVEATNLMVWTTDVDGAPNADAPSWRAFTGQSEAEWRARQAWDPIHPEDVQGVRDAWANAKATSGPFEAEFRLRRHDGVYLWMATRSVLLRQPDGSPREWFGVTYDISDRKRAELEREAAIERERLARVEAERAQSWWTTTLHSIGDAVVATEADGRVRFMNAVAEALTGWSLAEAVGLPLADVFKIRNESTGQVVESPVDRVLQEGRIVALANHTVLIRRDGTAVPIQDSAAPIRGSDGVLHGVVLVFRDVTAEKHSDAERSFLARAGEALLMATDYRDALVRVVQLAVPRLADWCAVDVLEPGATTAVQLAVAHVDPQKVAFARELGLRYPPDPNAATGVPNVLRTGRSELYPDLSPELVEGGAIDAEHLRIIRELKLRSAMVVPLRGRDRVFGAMTFVYAESGRSYSENDLLFAEDLARQAGVAIERRRLEEERTRILERERQARREAEFANRAKDEFLAMVSHELRTPLNAILGWTVAVRRKQPPPDLDRHLAVIERNARAQARLIEDVLDVSRIVSGKLRLDLVPCDVADVARSAVDAARPSAEAKGVVVETHVSPEVGIIAADVERLGQVINNLLSNAIKFTPPGGRVDVDVARRGGSVRIAIADTGAGIEPSLVGAIFEPFRQEDSSMTRRHGGLGLGLAIVRQLVQAHGGTVRAESEGKGKGATFVVELPAERTTLTPPPPAVGATDGSRLQGIRVLVVEDDADSRELVREVLRDAGALVVAAPSAAEAIEEFEARRPDVIVSDIAMPDLDGYAMVERIRALPPSAGGDVPAAALTAYARGEDVDRAFAVGFQAHLAKPIEPDRLVAVVARLARRDPVR